MGTGHLNLVGSGRFSEYLIFKLANGALDAFHLAHHHAHHIVHRLLRIKVTFLGDMDVQESGWR